MKNILIILLSLSCLCAASQNLIGPINIALPANPSASTADWATGTTVPFIITAQAKRENGQVSSLIVESKILVTIKAGGNKVCGNYTPNTAPQSNFNGSVKSWSGAAAVGLIGEDCKLNPGTYSVCVSFWVNGKSISDEVCKEFTIASTETNCTPPQNINPFANKTISVSDLIKPITFNWTPSVGVNSSLITYRLSVWEVEEGQSAAQAIYDNFPVLQKDIKSQTSFVASPNTWEKRTGRYVWQIEAMNKEGNPLCRLSASEPSQFVVQGTETAETPNLQSHIDFKDTTDCCVKDSCLQLDTLNYKITCAGVDSSGKYKYKISGLTLKNNSRFIAKMGLTANVAGVNYIVPNPANSFLIKKLTPITATTISAGRQVDISFEASAVTGNQLTFTVQGSIIKDGKICDIELPFTSAQLPICGCSYCNDTSKSNILLLSSSALQIVGNKLNIVQKFNAGPTNITKLGAEIVDISEDAIATACRACAINENAVWKFVPMNKASWNSLPGINGSPVNSAGLYPSKKIEWFFNKQGNLKLDLKIALPGIVTSPQCKRKGKIAIRYSFTDANCITCEKLVYYDYLIN